MDRPIFGYDDEGSNVAWTWNVKPIEKLGWKTWKPKLNNVKIIGLTDEKECARLQKEIYESVMLSEYPKKEKLTGMYKQRGYK
mgnify:FL=1|jgi:hypothetical protein